MSPDSRFFLILSANVLHIVKSKSRVRFVITTNHFRNVVVLLRQIFIYMNDIDRCLNGHSFLCKQNLSRILLGYVRSIGTSFELLR